MQTQNRECEYQSLGLLYILLSSFIWIGSSGGNKNVNWLKKNSKLIQYEVIIVIQRITYLNNTHTKGKHYFKIHSRKMASFSLIEIEEKDL